MAEKAIPAQEFPIAEAAFEPVRLEQVPLKSVWQLNLTVQAAGKDMVSALGIVAGKGIEAKEHTELKSAFEKAASALGYTISWGTTNESRVEI